MICLQLFLHYPLHYKVPCDIIKSKFHKRLIRRTETFYALPKAAKQIRVTVFMQEQGFTEEFDTLDGVATHLVAFSGKTIIATLPSNSNSIFLNPFHNISVIFVLL